MSDNFQAPPPTYGDVVNKSQPPVFGERAAMYSVPQQEYIGGEAKYAPVNPTMPVAYGVQVAPVTNFSKNPIQCTCAHCRSTIITRTECSNGLLTWILCLFLVLFGCWLGCCLIPFCISDLQNVQHYCPNCNAFLGEYRPL